MEITPCNTTGWGSTILEAALEKGLWGSFVNKELTMSQEHVFAAGDGCIRKRVTRRAKEVIHVAQ